MSFVWVMRVEWLPSIKDRGEIRELKLSLRLIKSTGQGCRINKGLKSLIHGSCAAYHLSLLQSCKVPRAVTKADGAKPGYIKVRMEIMQV
jgi:hypothetical protein